LSTRIHPITPRRKMPLVMALSALLSLCIPDAALAAASAEYQVKTAYLYNFAKFIQWPADAFADSSSPIVIGILGEDPFGSSLDQVISQRQAQGRSLRIERYQSLADIKHCHLLFVSRSEAKRQSELLRAIADSGLATVGESADFTHDGGQIRFFFTSDQTIKIEVNPQAAKRAGIFISSRIMKIARIYQPADRLKNP
jgi:hypothetical protein